ncbi:transporter [Geobacter anodireducens]|uniref:transporter n=1 Tax=Geobacter soli TaxID=1510391 RepID=UPI000A7EBCCB|nr:transporter [Geobacter soli]
MKRMNGTTAAMLWRGRLILSLFVACALLCISRPAALAAERRDAPVEGRRGAVGLGVDFATGDYGSGTSTDFIAVPLIVDLYPTERLDLELIIPWVYQTNGDNAYGTVMPYRQGYARGAATATGTRFQAGAGGSSGSTAGGSAGSASGLGDITLTAGYIIIPEGTVVPRVRPLIYLKFPTADENKGLGTGKFDAGGGLALDKWLGDWRPFGEAVWIVQGSSDLYATKDYLSYEAGLGRQFTPSLYAAILGRGATAPAEDSDAPFEGRLKGVYAVGSMALEGYVAAGLSDASPDFAAGLTVFYDF